MHAVLGNERIVGRNDVVVRHLQAEERKTEEERTLGAGGEMGIGRERERWVERLGPVQRWCLIHGQTDRETEETALALDVSTCRKGLSSFPPDFQPT